MRDADYRLIRETRSKNIIAFGWDSLLATYFARIGPEVDGDIGDEYLIQFGTSLFDIENVEVLSSLLFPYYVLTPDEKNHLIEAKNNNPTPPFIVSAHNSVRNHPLAQTPI